MAAKSSSARTDDLIGGLGFAAGLEEASSISPRITSVRGAKDGDLARALVQLTNDRFQSADEEAWARRGQGRVNVEYFLGHHRSRWNRSTRSIDRSPKRPSRERNFPQATINYFQAIMRTAIARLLSTYPVLACRAGSAENSAQRMVRVCQRILADHEWRRQKMPRVLAQLVPMVLLKNEGWLKTTFDPDIGSLLPSEPLYMLDDDGNPVPAPMQTIEQPIEGFLGLEGFAGENGTPGMSRFELPPEEPFERMRDPETGEPMMSEERPEGGTVTYAVDPDEMLVDDSMADAEQASWKMHVPWRALSYIRQRWQDIDVPAEERNDDDRPEPRRTARRNTHAAQLLELHLPSGRYPFGSEGTLIDLPDGYMSVCANGVFLEGGEEPDGDPFIHVPAGRIPGELHGDSFANAVRMIQKQINSHASIVMLSSALAGSPIWTANYRHRIKNANLVGTPGAIMYHEHVPNVPPPMRHDGRSVAGSVMGYLKFLLDALHDVSGQHEGGLAGGSPPRVEAAVHMEAIAERDLAKLYATAAELGWAMETWGKKTLKHWQRHKRHEQTIAVTGESLGVEVMQFSGAEIDDTLEVYVVPESSQPRSRAQMLNYDIFLFQNKFITARDFMRRRGDESNEPVSSGKVHADYARRENYEAVQTGKISTTIEQAQWHDQDIHLEEHLFEMLSDSTSDEAKMAIEKHLAEVHQPLINAVRQKQAEAQGIGANNQIGPEGPQAPPEPAQGQGAEELLSG